MDERLLPLEPSAALLALNNAHAVELSWLEPERFAAMMAMAFWARQVGTDDAFLIAMDQDAAYDSPNFLWLRARYERFVYVDRVVVADHARGRGLAQRLAGPVDQESLDPRRADVNSEIAHEARTSELVMAFVKSSSLHRSPLGRILA